jgi:dTDP-4-dehydrorhamnose 3,5-epimerase
MKLEELSISGLFRLESPVWADDRGFFREWFVADSFGTSAPGFITAQTNLSFSTANVVRGLHYSLAPEGQAKVVTCVAGELVDVIVDIRVGSPTYGKYEAVTLRPDEGCSLLLPGGVAHGFCVVGESATMAYLLSSPFNPTMELEINPFDEEIGIAWPISGPAILSPKDSEAPSLSQRRKSGQLPVFPA